jgi:hypothetical protein
MTTASQFLGDNANGSEDIPDRDAQAEDEFFGKALIALGAVILLPLVLICAVVAVIVTLGITGFAG